MRFYKHLFVIVAAISALFLAGCEEEEDRKIFSSQKCLNGLGDSPTEPQVESCLNIIAGVENVQANIIRCSGYFIAGGLTNSKIITAFKAYKDADKDEKEAVLIKQLSLGDSTNPNAMSNADKAFEYCKKTNIPGLTYVASLCRMGTIVDQMTCGGVTCANIDDAINDFVSNGTVDNKKQVGEMVVLLGDLYCQGETKTSNICVEIASARQAAGGNLEQLAEILLNQFL